MLKLRDELAHTVTWKYYCQTDRMFGGSGHDSHEQVVVVLRACVYDKNELVLVQSLKCNGELRPVIPNYEIIKLRRMELSKIYNTHKVK